MSTIPREAPPDVPSVTIATLPDNAVMLDVRETPEWTAGRAPAAVHIPLSELPRRMDDLPANRPLVVTCRSGGRSARAVAFLRREGYDAVNLHGGMMAWHRANRPLCHDGSGAPFIE